MLEVEAPIDPPGRWMRLKSWLSERPGLGRLTLLQRARADMANIRGLRDQQTARSLACLDGYVTILRATYGENIAGMCEKQYGLAGKPLTQRMVLEAFMRAESRQLEFTQTDTYKPSDFLNGDGPDSMDGEFHAANPGVAAKILWRDAVSEDAARFIETYFRACCDELSVLQLLEPSDLKRIAQETLSVFADIMKQAGGGLRADCAFGKALPPVGEEKRTFAIDNSPVVTRFNKTATRVGGLTPTAAPGRSYNQSKERKI